ncbi:MAG TPA: hypothetical protein VFH68_16905 [Polyangia bacterium]|jgi:hypothetical protein|nr:hypothetical protein [Polyangia bacterium]
MERWCARVAAGLIAVGFFAGFLIAGPSPARAADKPAPTPAPPAAASPAAAPLSLTAKLVEIPSQFPPDELYDYAYVMRYEVVGGPLDKQSILVAHYKPRLPRAKIKDQMKAQVAGKLRSFKTGDLHKLELSPELKRIWRGALVDDFAATDRKSIRYWALVADPA